MTELEYVAHEVADCEVEKEAVEQELAVEVPLGV